METMEENEKDEKLELVAEAKPRNQKQQMLFYNGALRNVMMMIIGDK